ncbi:hypothetical protein CEXT_21001 [Caerostris extrusa]|uniref:Uncharacterized protein n=1 Tax=Caerostris extrusa TaxID=172846 RepID=A0AAV4QJ71_CAEEX|nr:hypothetical protein CEXT_21001 [Caerostris extrusa]
MNSRLFCQRSGLKRIDWDNTAVFPILFLIQKANKKISCRKKNATLCFHVIGVSFPTTIQWLVGQKRERTFLKYLSMTRIAQKSGGHHSSYILAATIRTLATVTN